MNPNYKFLMVLPLIAFATHVKAQLTGGSSTVDLTLIESKKDFNHDRYSDIKGLPYLLKDWAIGSVKSSNNVEKKGLMLNFDEIRNQLLIKGSNDELMNVFPPAIEFSISDNNVSRIFKLGYAPTSATDLNSFFEVLVDGKIQFLKRNKKGISENKEYSGNVVKSITDDIRYFMVIHNNEPIQVKLDQKSILPLLTDKESEVADYLKSSKLNLKKQEDIIKLIRFYNTLK